MIRSICSLQNSHTYTILTTIFTVNRVSQFVPLFSVDGFGSKKFHTLDVVFNAHPPTHQNSE